MRDGGREGWLTAHASCFPAFGLNLLLRAPAVLCPRRPLSPAASLAERVEPGQAAVTFPARDGGLAGAGARAITLGTQGAWGRKGTGQWGLEQGEGGIGCGGLPTCWVAVAGLARRPWVPAIEVLLAVLTVWPGRVVAAVEAAPTMASAAEELPVKRALLRVAAAVTSCGQEAGDRASEWLWHMTGGSPHQSASLC